MRPADLKSLKRRIAWTVHEFARATPAQHMLFAALLVGIATTARILLGRYFENLSPYATFYMTVEISALLAGLSAGLVATIASASVACLWFSAATDLSLGLFVAGGVIFSVLTDLARSAWRGSVDIVAADDRSHSTPQPYSHALPRDCPDTVGEMAATLAHDVNQPLAATVTYLKVARRLLEKSQIDAPEVFSVLEKATEQTLRAGRIVASIRDIVRRRELDKTLVRVNALVGELIELHETFTARSDAFVEFEQRARRDCVLADREQLRQAISELSRITLEGMGADETRRLLISTSNPDEHTIRLDVIDAGSDLPASWRDGASEPFVSTKTNSMSAGLSISRSIIEQHEGQLWATPNQNGETVFSFVLPLAETEINA